MARVKLIQTREDIAPEHHALFDELAARRGRISGPSTVVLHSPGLAKPWNDVSEALHGGSIVEEPAAELAVCVTAREFDCSYIWNAHRPRAREGGVSSEALAAVHAGAELDGLPASEALVARYARQLVRGNRVEPDVFGALLSQHNPRWLVELTVWIGRYSALAGILNAFEVLPAPGGERLPDRQPEARTPHAPPAPGPQPRLPLVTTGDNLSASDRAVFDAVTEGRGNVRGPFALLMHSPPLCKTIFDVSNYLRFGSQLSPRLRELATIATARERDCPYVWAAHAPAARREGIDDALIEAVRDRREVATIDSEAADIVAYARAQLLQHRVPQPLFERLLGACGLPRFVELTALIGHYVLVCCLLNACEVAPVAGAEVLPLV